MSTALDYTGVQFEEGGSADDATDTEPSEGAETGTDTSAGPTPGTPVGSPNLRPPANAASSTDDTATGSENAVVENEVFDIPSQFGAVSVPPPSKKEEAHRALRQWEGVVEATRGDEFVARLTALDSEDVEDEIVTLDRARVAEDDRALIEPGAVFYWNIGETHTVDGQLRNYSEIRFRRLPKRTERDLERTAERAAELKTRLFGEEAG